MTEQDQTAQALPDRISGEEWTSWAQSRVTKAFVRQVILAKVEEAKADWAAKAYVGSTAEESNHMNCFALGSVDVLKQVAALVEDIAQSEGSWLPGQ